MRVYSVACAVAVFLAANVCTAQSFNGATSLDTHTGYFEAITKAPHRSTPGGWTASMSSGTPLITSVTSGGTKTATQVSANGRITAKTYGYGKAGQIVNWANAYARVGASATAGAAAVAADIAESEAEAQSSGTFNAPAAFTTVLMYNFVHPNVAAPVAITYGSLWGNCDGNTEQMRYHNGSWQLHMTGIGWTNVANTSTALTKPGYAMAAGSAGFSAGATINTQTAGAGGGFATTNWSADVANF